MNNKIIKAISLWEPWASLIRTGAKTYETRSWKTAYRGPLLICAAKGGASVQKIINLLNDPKFQLGLRPIRRNTLSYVYFENLNFGKAVAVVSLENCLPVDIDSIAEISEAERNFGDFSPGRYMWKLKMLNNIFEPFPVKGKQGFFEVDMPEGIIE